MPRIVGGRIAQEPEDPFGLDPGGVLSGGGQQPSGPRKPLGVEEGYVAVRPQMWTPSPGRSGRVNLDALRYTVDQPPRYFEDDQYAPRNQSPDKIWEQQQLLVSLGLLKGRFLKRIWDEPTAQAWASVLAYANQHGLTDAQALIELARGGEEGLVRVDEKGNIVPVGEGTATLPPPIEQTDPRVLKEVFRKAAIEISGRGWSDEQLNKAASAYNALERERQEQMYNAQQFGGTYTSMPSPEAYIDSYIRDIQPGQVQLHEGIQWAEEAMQLLGSPAWGVSA